MQSGADEIEAKIGSPQHCGSTGGEYFPFAFSDELPDEQSADDQLSLCYDGPVTEHDGDIVGAPTVTLKIKSGKPNGQLAVRLCDLRPDGTSALITLGYLNLTHRNSHEIPEPLVPGEVVEVNISLDQIAYHQPKGHRMRVAISTSHWPAIWPSPEQGEVTVLNGSIDVPMRAANVNKTDEWKFEEPEGAPAWRCEELRPASYERITRQDTETGFAHTIINADSGENRDLEHGLISGSWCKEQFSIHPDDPLSARCAAQWEQTGGREGAMWRTHVDAEMWSDKMHFHSRATLQTFLNDELFFERTYEDSIGRDLV